VRGRGFWVIGLVVASVVVAGCGSSGGSSSTASGANGSSTSTSAGEEESGKSKSPENGEGGKSGGSGESSGATGATGGEGGGKTPSFESPAAKKSEFIKRGDLICEEVPQEYGKKVQALEKELQKKKGKKLLQKNKVPQEEATLKAGVPPLRTAAKKFEKLGPPEGEEEQALKIIEALEAAADALEQDPSLPLVGPKSPFKEFEQLTKKFGFKFCPQL
jgi:hypothetical protein